MLAGLLSGPLALAFAIIVGDFTSNDAARPLQLGGLAVLVGGAFVFSIVTHNRYSNSSHDRLFSSIGIGAPVVWFLAICGLVIYGFSQMQ